MGLLADAGAPMIFLTFPLLICALVPVIFVEVWVAKPMLGAGYGKSIWVVTLANVISTIIGVPMAWLAMLGLELLAGLVMTKAFPNAGGPVINAVLFLLTSAWLGPDSNLYWEIPVAAMILLIPTFFASWYIEAFIVDRIVEPEWPVVRKAMLKANLASYALLFVAGCGWLIFSVVRYRPR